MHIKYVFFWVKVTYVELRRDMHDSNLHPCLNQYWKRFWFGCLLVTHLHAIAFSVCVSLQTLCCNRRRVLNAIAAVWVLFADSPEVRRPCVVLSGLFGHARHGPHTAVVLSTHLNQLYLRYLTQCMLVVLIYCVQRPVLLFSKLNKYFLDTLSQKIFF